MIISHKYRFIFIKTIKTAGTSIEVYLSRHCGADDVLTPVLPPVEGHQPRNYGRLFNHVSAWVVSRVVPADVWQGYFKFCVERNPWDKTISDYCMLNQRFGRRYTLQNYLDRGRFCSSWELYTDRDDRTLLVDRVLRWERLDEELGQVFGQLGVPFGGQLEVRAKSGYRTDRRPYQEWYTAEQQAVVARAFVNEIREFGYAF